MEPRRVERPATADSHHKSRIRNRIGIKVRRGFRIRITVIRMSNPAWKTSVYGNYLAKTHGAQGQLPALQLELLAEDELHGLGPAAGVVQQGVLLVHTTSHKVELDLGKTLYLTGVLWISTPTVECLWKKKLKFMTGEFSDFIFFMYCIQHGFICRHSEFTVSEDAGIEPRTVANFVIGSQTL